MNNNILRKIKKNNEKIKSNINYKQEILQQVLQQIQFVLLNFAFKKPFYYKILKNLINFQNSNNGLLNKNKN